MMNWLNFVPKLVAVVLDEKNPTNISHPIAGFEAGQIYLVMGQVAHIIPDALDDPIEGIHHYVLLNLRTGQVMPGMYHDDRFRAATEDEI